MPDFTNEPQPIIKIELKANGGSNGFSETYYFKALSEANYFDQAEKAARRLAFWRSRGMCKLQGTGIGPKFFTFVGFTLSTTDGTNLSYPGMINPGTLEPLLERAADFTAGLLVQLRHESGLIKRTMLLRGIPQIYDFNAGRLRNPINPVGPVITFLNDLGTYLNNATVELVPLGYFCIRTEGKDGPGVINELVVDVTLDPVTANVAYVLAPSITYPKSGAIHVSGVKGKCAKGLNGKSNIVSYSASSESTIITTDRKWCCDAPPTVWPGGRLKPVVYQYARIAPPESASMPGIGLQRGGERQMGGAFFGTRGRARKRCC